MANHYTFGIGQPHTETDDELTPVGLSPDGTSLVSGDRNILSSGTLTRVNLRDWNGFDNTGSNSMLSIMQAAQLQLEAAGAGRIELERGTYALDGKLYVRGGAPTLNSGYQGQIQLVGQSKFDTILQFSGAGSGIAIDTSATPTGNNNAQAMIEIMGLKLIGPGKATSGSVGIDCGPQGNWQSTPNAIKLFDLWMTGWENCARFDDTTNLYVQWCYFLEYVKGLRFGYNQDTMTIGWNRFGNNQTVIGSQTEIALAWDYMSPRFGSGGVAGTVGVAPNAAATLAGAQNHLIFENWFMRQALIADMADPSTSGVTFWHNQAESCKHYAQMGNTTSTTAPQRITWKQNCFMRHDGQEQTQAMFKWMNPAGSGSMKLEDNVGDAATGPKMGWVECGTNSVVEFDNNVMPVAGGYVTEANHLIVGASGKKVTIPAGGYYKFFGAGGVGGTEERQFNASGRDGVPDRIHTAYNATNLTLYQRWVAKAAGSDAVSGNAYDMKGITVNGTRFATAYGLVQPLAASATPSLGSDGAIARGGLFLKQGAGGAADELYCCMKSAADTYSWKLVATG